VWRGGVILLYHRVFDTSSDPQMLCVSPEHFAEHLEILKKHYNPMKLQDLTRCTRDGGLPRRAVAVTFDDGYADNLHEALPLLKAADVPATVFVVAGHVGTSRELWWDELERVLLEPAALPSHLSLNISGTLHEWALGASACSSPEDALRRRGWRVSDSEPTARERIYRDLHRLLRPLSEHERARALDTLRTWAGIGPAGRHTHRVLRDDEMRLLEEDELVEVGAHSMSHPVLSALPLAQQQTEIANSKKQLEEMLGHPTGSFSYPFGQRLDYTDDTVVSAQKAGFTCACSAFPAPIRPGSDVFQLPRACVSDLDGETFARKLEEWSAGR